MQSNESFRNLIEDKLKTFENNTLFKATYALFDALGIRFKTKTEQPLVGGLKAFYGKDIIPNNLPIYQHVQKVFFIGQITDASFGIFLPEADYDEALKQVGASYKGIFVFAIELRVAPTRTEMAALTRSINQLSKHVPVIVVYCYKRNENLLITLAATERLKYVQNWREGEKIGKISILKDINIKQPHAGHIRILADLKLSEAVFTFDKLLEQWRKVFDTQTLNNNFYKDLLHWYLATVKQIRFIGNNDDKTRAILTIKIVSRLIFLWFLKEKGLIAQQLFNKDWLKKHLTTFEDNDNSFYIGILANLFFNTVNEKIENRFKKYNILYEYLFLNPDSVKQAFNCSPFVNGGLFDPSEQEAATHLHQWQQMFIPNKFFFGTQKADLHEDLNDKKSTNVEIKGLIDILSSYKFTIEENTPLESEVALDPELLGKIFENLLASYNEETKTTARKATGSYYTPREIVEYMVDQSLIAYLEGKLFPDENSLEQQTPITSHSLGDAPDLFANANNPEIHITKPKQRTLEDLFQEQAFDNTQNTEKEQFRKDLTALLRYDTEGGVTPSFATQYTHRILDAIDTLKILDPAVGSGAFPMGILQKITLLLKRIDPNNQQWLKRMLDRIKDKQLRKATAEKWKNENIEYIRKLGIIESAIYGIDIQPIAVQIAKLRFFISLVIEQATNNEPQENYGIQPLPNLDFKLVCANTLIDVPTVTKDILNAEINDFGESVTEYFSAVGTEKKQLKQQIEQTITAIYSKNIKYLAQWQKPKARNAKEEKNAENRKAELEQAANLWSTYPNLFKDEPVGFFNMHYFYPSVAAQGGFDIVIGNPPYIRADNLSVAPIRAMLEQSNQYQTLWEKWDMMVPFYERSLRLLNLKGINAFIASNSITTSKFAAKLQDWILANYSVVSIDYFDDDVSIFDAGVVPVITILQNTKNSMTIKKYRKQSFENIYQVKNVRWEASNNLRETIFKKQFSTIFLPQIEYTVLGDICYISKGIVTNSDEFDAQGEFNKNDLVSDEYNSINCMPYIEGKYLKRYIIEKIKYLEWNTDRIPSKLSRPTFPALYQGEKIMRGRVTEGTYDNTGLLCNDSIIILKRFIDLKNVSERSIGVSISKNNFEWKGSKTSYMVSSRRNELETISNFYYLKYLLAVINSNYAKAYLNNYRRHRLENYFYPDDFRKYPIPKISPNIQHLFVSLVDYILYLKSHPLSTTEEELMPIYFERLIDGMVYELYFEAELKAAKVDVLAHLGNLPPLSNVDTDDAKMAMLKTVFNRLYDPRSEVRNRLTFMQNVKEIAIIEGKK